jgi:hypothetical protein
MKVVTAVESIAAIRAKGLNQLAGTSDGDSQTLTF